MFGKHLGLSLYMYTYLYTYVCVLYVYVHMYVCIAKGEERSVTPTLSRLSIWMDVAAPSTSKTLEKQKVQEERS
jgi:hypothetical protein